MLTARDQECVDSPLARYQRPAGALKLGIDESDVERGIVDDQRRIAEKGDQVLGHLGEKQLVFEEIVAEAVDGKRLRRHAALRIEIGVEGLAGGYPVDQLDAADLDQAMAVQRIETRGLGIEHNLAHENSQSAVDSDCPPITNQRT